MVGATATGKSSLAHELALAAGDVELLSVDAMGVYRGMDLATAKPSPAQRAEVAYHLLDLAEPSEEFTVAQFQRHAREAAAAVAERGHLAIYVGGTGLYHRAVLDDLEIPGRYPEALAEWAGRPTEELYAELAARDPLAASRTTPANRRRVERALEVTLGSGRPFSSFGPGLTTYPEGSVIEVGLRVDAGVLDERIERRFRHWLDQGLVDEVRRLAAGPLSRTARQAVGYRELLEHVERGADLEDCVTRAVAATRRLARRQRRWFERDPRVEWFEDPGAAAARVADLLDEMRRGRLPR